jgi:hypothetical protein
MSLDETKIARFSNGIPYIQLGAALRSRKAMLSG